MNSTQFISSIREVVREYAIEGAISNIKNPPGRRVSDFEKKRADWFNKLDDIDRIMIDSIITYAVDEAIFGFLSVIDGTRSIENSTEKGSIILIHRGKYETVLNDPEQICLHDLYNSY